MYSCQSYTSHTWTSGSVWKNTAHSIMSKIVQFFVFAQNELLLRWQMCVSVPPRKTVPTKLVKAENTNKHVKKPWLLSTPNGLLKMGMG